MQNPFGNILWVLFAFVLIVFSVISLVLTYHWREYGTVVENKTFARVQMLYYVVGLALIAVSAVSIFFI